MNRHIFIRGIKRRLFSSTTTRADGMGGAGLGNVHDQMLPTIEGNGRNLFRHIPEPRTVSIIGAPMSYGQPFTGTDKGPTLLRENQLLSKLSNLGWRIEDNPDLSFPDPDGTTATTPTNAKNSTLVGPATHQIASLVYEKSLMGHFPLIIGGDHSIAIGSLAGRLRAHPNMGVLWIDAHADLNTPEISPSGNMHGMPLGLLLDGIKRSEQYPPGLEWLNDPEWKHCRLPPHRLVYIGLRDVDHGEREAIHRLGIPAYTMFDVDHWGIGTVMDKALQHLGTDHPIHLSYDIDAVDPAWAPATGTAVRGGLTFREAHFVAESAVRSGALGSAELVEFNPTMTQWGGVDAGKETGELALQLVTSLMGKSII